MYRLAAKRSKLDKTQTREKQQPKVDLANWNFIIKKELLETICLFHQLRILFTIIHYSLAVCCVWSRKRCAYHCRKSMRVDGASIDRHEKTNIGKMNVNDTRHNDTPNLIPIGFLLTESSEVEFTRKYDEIFEWFVVRYISIQNRFVCVYARVYRFETAVCSMAILSSRCDDW